KLTGGKRALNRELETKARAVAGIKGYITNRLDLTAEQVIAAYHQLWHVEKALVASRGRCKCGTGVGSAQEDQFLEWKDYARAETSIAYRGAARPDRCRVRPGG